MWGRCTLIDTQSIFTHAYNAFRLNWIPEENRNVSRWSLSCKLAAPARYVCTTYTKWFAKLQRTDKLRYRSDIAFVYSFVFYLSLSLVLSFSHLFDLLSRIYVKMFLTNAFRYDFDPLMWKNLMWKKVNVSKKKLS